MYILKGDFNMKLYKEDVFQAFDEYKKRVEKTNKLYKITQKDYVTHYCSKYGYRQALHLKRLAQIHMEWVEMRGIA